MPSLPEAPEQRGFAREIKFLVPPGQAELIRQWARSRLEPDPHAGGPTDDIYRISSLYFDTPRLDVYCRSGSYGRAKYRIRRYDDGKKAFLERKLKSRGVVGKRRSTVKVKELGHLENGEPDRDWPGFWFHRRLLLRGLNPICQVSYVRTARVTRNAFGPVRLTLDEDLRVQPANAFRFRDARDGVSMTGGLVVVEMKFRLEMPAALQELVEEFGLVQQPVSKYRLAAGILGYAAESVSNPPLERKYA